MRYLPESNCFFVHIPKNGGQSVRNAMQRTGKLSFAPLAKDLGVDEAVAEQTAEQGFTHPSLGSIHPAHLPLWAMRDAFPESWKVFESCTTLALTRDPRSRFMSALMQRLKEFSSAGAIRADDTIVTEESKRVCDWLSGQSRHADLEYVHFIRQVDFTDLDGVRRLDGVFPVSETEKAAEWLRETSGLDLEIQHDHARREPKKWARGIQPIARFAANSLMPHSVKRALHPIWTKSGVFRNAAAGYSSVDLGSDVEDFVKAYYAEDFNLHEEAIAHAKSRGTMA